ncbi:MAG: hypothetical protein ACYS0I_10980 [Planctomycetota bacterium]|jgi:hypothetical protein
MNYQDSQFKTAVAELLDTLIQFRSWIDRQKKINVSFMKSYKKHLEKDIGPTIKQFEEKYQYREEGQSPSFQLIMKSFACFKRPITFMQTQLRPSVGMGIFLERWMLTRAVQDYLKECCQEADSYLDELTNKSGL